MIYKTEWLSMPLSKIIQYVIETNCLGSVIVSLLTANAEDSWLL